MFIVVLSLCKPTIAVLILGTTLEHVCCLLLLPKARIVGPRVGDGGYDLMPVAVKGNLLELSSEIGTGYLSIQSHIVLLSKGAEDTADGEACQVNILLEGLDTIFTYC